MVLRFEVNQSEAFRRGVDVEKSTNHLQVDPSTLSQDDRNLIADRLDGIDVLQLEVKYDGAVVQSSSYADIERRRIKAKLPTYEALMEAIRENQMEIEKELTKRKAA